MPLLNAFLDARNDDLFTTIANFRNARELAEMDVPEHQRAAREAIFDAIIHALKLNPSPGARIALVKGEAGSGKSHVLSTMLRGVIPFTEHRQHSVFPVILQFTAPVTLATYDVWLLDAVIRELSARHFGDEDGHSPLRRLADKLLDFVDQSRQEEFRRAIDDLDNDAEFLIAFKIGRYIAREAQVWLTDDLSAGLVGAVLLAGYGDASALNYLRHGQVDRHMAELLLTSITTGEQRIGIIRDLSGLAQLVRGCLVLGFDQVENIVRLGDEGLFVHALTQAVRLVEKVPNCAVVFAVLADAYEAIVSGRRGSLALTESDLDRIEREAPFPTKLDVGPSAFRRAVVSRRLALLRERAQLAPVSDAFAPLPPWLLPAIDQDRSVRRALREVSEFRNDAMKRGRLPTETEYRALAVPPEKKQIEIDFAKAWEDFKDQGSTITRRLLDAKKAELLAWWALEASREHVRAEPADVELRTLDDEFKTPVIDIRLKVDGMVVEHRALALCEAPNRNQKLADQVGRFLEVCDSATPFVLRTKGFAKSPTAQVAPALRTLAALGGRAFDLNDTEWDLISRAHDFFMERQDAHGLLAWRLDAQWLRQLASTLLPLVTLPDVIETPQPPPPPTGREQTPGNGASRTLDQGGPPSRAAASEAASAGTEDEAPDRSGRTGPGPQAAGPAPADGPFPVLIGNADDQTPVYWSPYAPAPDHLNNFSMLVTGDAGSGKTQTIRVLIDAACRADLSVIIFDFKADYCSPDFAGPLGIEVVDVRTKGLPFNPLEPPPLGPSGAQPIEHAHEIAGILARVYRLGIIQEGRLRDAICAVYRECGIDPQDWIQPNEVSWPSFNRVIEVLAEAGDNASLVTRLGALRDFRLFSAGGTTPMSAAKFFEGRVCLQLSNLPGDEIKAAIAEILIVQLHGHLLRGAQPRRLTRMLVFDEAHRVKESRRLETLAREGRAFGVGIIIGTQFPGDMPSDMAGNMATQLFLMNNQAQHRRAVVAQVCGTTATGEAKMVLDRLGHLRPFQGLFSNPHYGATFVEVVPHYQRTKASSP